MGTTSPIKAWLLVLAVGLQLMSSTPFPSDHRALETSISLPVALSFLKSIEKPGFITLSEEGRSPGGRPIPMLRFAHGGSRARFRALFYAQQHGNETSGKDALLYLARTLADSPERLPEDVELYVIPSLNPDGWVANRRSNDAGADLNRDHLLLEQPETQALHRVVRRIRPHLAVDGHEFTRDSSEFTQRGWTEWPLITMDSQSHPLIPKELRDLGRGVVESARPRLAAKGHPYTRYTLGGPPPDEEIRPSTPEADDGRNGLGSLGCLSFIIEAGIKRATPNPQADLGARVDAYLELYWHLIGDPDFRERCIQAVARAEAEPLPTFLPVNYFWASLEPRSVPVKVVERVSGRVLEVPSGNHHETLVIKTSVPTPAAYAIDPRAADRYRPFLERHGLQYEILSIALKVRAEECVLLRVEETFDESYLRYGGRQVVTRKPVSDQVLPPGTLLVRLQQPLARRAVQVLEPCELYGLFQHAAFRTGLEKDGILPISRVMSFTGR